MIKLGRFQPLMPVDGVWQIQVTRVYKFGGFSNDSSIYLGGGDVRMWVVNTNSRSGTYIEYYWTSCVKRVSAAEGQSIFDVTSAILGGSTA